jgi:uncharacterized protein (DUF58 family)
MPSLRGNAFALVLLTAAIAVVGDWSGEPVLGGLWRFCAALLLLGLAYECWTVARAAWTFDCELPESLFLGRGDVVKLRYGHRTRRTWTLQVAPSAPDSVVLEDSIASLALAPGAPATLACRVSACQLGRFAWPPSRVRAAGPFGLAWWPRLLSCDRHLRVVPDMFRSGAEVRGAAQTGAQAGYKVGEGLETLRLRDYRDGDPPRVIDWKATARAGRLISRDFMREHDLQIVIAVDAGRSSGLRAGALDRFGHYVNVAARLAQFAAERDDLVGLVIYADRPLAALAPARGAAAVARLRALLGTARLERTESNPLYAATRVKSLVRHRSLIVLLTDVDDASAESQLAQAVRFLLPKHLPFVAALSSADAEAMARAPARGWLDPYRALAAQEYCTGLSRKIRALNALGAPALVARPEHLEHAVFAAYEDLQRLRRA